MDVGQAIAMRHVGAISGAKVIERPAADGNVWIVEFEMEKPLPSSVSHLLEVARGGPKIFKTVQAALNDLKSVGMSSATVQFTAEGFFRRNRFDYLYPWIQGLQQQGYDEERILDAFTTLPSVLLDRNNQAEVKQGRIIIRHALGLSDGKELEAYLPPFDVLDVHYVKRTDDGHLCRAACSDSQHDFTFLVSVDVPEKVLKRVIAERKTVLCQLALVAAHQRNPQSYDDPDNPPPVTGNYQPPVAAFRLTVSDIECVRGSDAAPGE